MRNARCGSTYLIVLFTTLIVTVIAFAGFQRLQLEQQQAELERDWNEAAVTARSAVEFALTKLGNDHDWRRAYQDLSEGNYSDPVRLGRGTMRWQLADPVDGDLAQGENDPVRIYGYGQVGDSHRVYSMLAWPSGSPLDVLRSAVHAGGDLVVQAAADVRWGPASANGRLQIASGELLGDVEAGSVDFPDHVVGTSTILDVAKTMPSGVVFSVYKSLAVSLTTADLGGGSNPTIAGRLVCDSGPPAATVSPSTDGVYLIQMAANQTLTIRDCRIAGTLLVELAAGAELEIGPNVLWHPARPDYPALLVDGRSQSSGNVVLNCSGRLAEADAGVNYNPAAVPYYGDSDDDQTDVYTASLAGLFHVLRSDQPLVAAETVVRGTEKIRGCVLSDGTIRIDADSILAADPMLIAKPPQGYATFPDPGNLLSNGDMESGTAGWTKLGSNTALGSDPEARSGASSLRVDARDTASSGVQQDVTGRVASDRPLASEVWIRLLDSDEAVTITLETDSVGDGVQRFVQTAQATTQWQRLQVEHQPRWSGPLTYARWQIATTTSNQAFLLDDAIVQQQASETATTLSAVPGSWRAEAVPSR
ncbi:carbohydrate binding domain-containing protein [Roseimaritima sediminicola]|uniref:carbohydrate binding domain-containing protein n=1 Tax=Roseimaritima sediminicola TaxID=2662066 RepID=UPI0012983B30|nr:carbohydrate binding domain-containing protein [Roseimaritima sediminicola]